MRKYFFVLVMLVANSAFAQVISGTIIAFNFTKDEIVVAADSLAVNQGTGTPNYRHCKIAAFSHQLIFTGAGNTGFAHGPTLLWDNVELARQSVVMTDRGTVDIDSTASRWANTVKDRWKSVDQTQARDIAAANGGQLTAGVFIDKDLNVRVALLSFDAGNLLDPIQYQIVTNLSICWPCGQVNSGHVCAGGTHLDAVANFCSTRKHGDSILIKTRLSKADKSAELATEIVESIIDTYEKTSKDVGGDVDVIAITKHGSIGWLARKDECPENQD